LRTNEMRLGWVPALLRGCGVLTTEGGCTVAACRFSAAIPIP
jgi:hypothetical protein